jgi:hypothetical protein
MAKARVTTAVMAKPGERIIWRKAKRRSLVRRAINFPLGEV